jgi:hypothetical protein
MERMTLLNNAKNNVSTERGWCNYEIIDKSELILIPGICASLGGFGYSLVSGTPGMSTITGVLMVSSLVAEWRVRALGIDKKLMDSVHVLEAENKKFANQVVDLENQITEFEGIVGLLDDNVHDITQVKTQLFDLYKKYKDENDRQESNNLLTLFGLVDKNEDSKLSSGEIKRMKEYIKIVYKEEFDFDILDTDDDGFVSLSEFFEKFRNRNNVVNIV